MRRNLILLLWLSYAALLNAVTFNVTVPAGTKECYIAAAFNNWDAANAIKMNPNGENKFTLDLPDITTALPGIICSAVGMALGTLAKRIMTKSSR